eukprot:4469436-Amphidinium_carterae.1
MVLRTLTEWAHQVWTLEQVFGTFYVYVPIRMTVLKASHDVWRAHSRAKSARACPSSQVADGLLVYAPVAATPECIREVPPC